MACSRIIEGIFWWGLILFFSFADAFEKMPHALVAELVDALDSKSSVFGRVGSIPTQGTQKTL